VAPANQPDGPFSQRTSYRCAADHGHQNWSSDQAALIARLHLISLFRGLHRMATFQPVEQKLRCGISR